MTRDRPLLVLLAAAAASYPALVLGWCVAALLGTVPAARELWLAGHPGALAAALLVLMAAVAVGNAARVLVRGLWQTWRFHRWVARRRVPPSGRAHAALAGWDAVAPVRLVGTRQPLAATAGLWRPYVVISSGLVAELGGAELRAVLAHEEAHARRRDPLRLLLGRALAAHLWFLPLAAEMCGRARRGYELAADRHAADRCGRAAVAGALLRLVSAPMSTASTAAFADPGFLRARVSQLESGQPPRAGALPRGRTALTMSGALAFVLTVSGAWMVMLLTCPGMAGL
ncbi:M56 family metallopeptidase [Qaidamihabitans albus]|uniref:M56 family metallopeptidase n=1 Tax=Qaidamihabitans albus TaxID=2795733 RepID=UPI0018F1D855|nr:M56 family metallopeptidase [Qaidamihabitans albus]